MLEGLKIGLLLKLKLSKLVSVEKNFVVQMTKPKERVLCERV